ncbi:MAG: M28 family peptidase, partial [Bacteroidetes bacterium]|nr:M28 family peptidase [Bacteroidota bacterium]
MVSLIQTIIERFGGRVAGTEAEREAQHYVEGVLDSYCDSVEWHEFTSALEAKFHSLKGFCITFVAAIILFAWNPYVAASVAVINAVLFFGHFVAFKDWLDFLYKQRSSCNVIGKIEPEGEVRSTIVVSGHIDSVREFQWWYRLKHIGGVLTTISGFLIVIQGPTYLAAALCMAALGYLPTIFTVFWWSHIILAPVLITFYTIHGNRKVEGALDNLTGVALSVEMAKVFGGQERLKHTRLKIISFGSEETGLRGARKYVEEHLDELRSEGAVNFNIDTHYCPVKIHNRLIWPLTC